MAGNQHHRQLRVEGMQVALQAQAVPAGQADVADHDAGKVIIQPGQRGFGAVDPFAGNVFQRQRLLAAQHHMGVVFDNQHTQGVINHAVGSP